MPAPHGRDGVLRPIYEPDDLPQTARNQLRQSINLDGEWDAIVCSDMLANGRFGESCLVIRGDELIVVEDSEVHERLELGRILRVESVHEVGNGRFVARTHSGKRLELMRYSQTLAEAFEEIAEFLNQRLDDDARAGEEELEQENRVSDRSDVYRCHSCGYPLKHAGDACPKCADKGQMARRLVRYIGDHKGLFIGGLVLSVLVTVANLGPGYLVRLMVDLSLNPPADASPTIPDRQRNLAIIIAVFFALMLMRLIAQRYQIRTIGKLGESIVKQLREQIYRALHRLSLNYYDKEHTGRIMARVTSDTRQVQAFIVQGATKVLTQGLLIVGITVILVVQDPLLAVIALLPVPVIVWIGRSFSKQFQSIYKRVRRRFATLSATVNDGVTGVRVVKAFGQEKREINTFESANEDCYDAHLTALESRSRFKPSVIFLMGIGTLVVWFVGGRQVMAGELTLGVLLQFITYMNMFRAPVQQLMNLTEIFQKSATAAERIFNVMDRQPEIRDHDNARELEQVEGDYRIRQVDFSYEEGEPILHDIDLEISAGEMIGLVGPTGSGKSTLALLICRFYDPTRGSIELDGHDLRDIRIESLRQHIGMVLQDPFLFAGTLRDNIAYGSPDASSEDIIRAAIAANAHDFIINLPDAYDTKVGERGVGLSGGEKQRISIARAILKDPAVLVLDEATSAVDTATEAQIQEAMDRLVEGRTTLAIAHRLSTLRNADRLVVLEDGHIAELGTHDELMEKDGMYATLCRIQADFANEVDAQGELAEKQEEAYV